MAKKIMPLRKYLSFWAILLLGTMVLMETVSFGIVCLIQKRIATPRQLFGSHLAKLPGNGACQWGDYVSPHPYLSIYYHHDKECMHPNINSWGLAGYELPLRKRKDRYTILILGASVAELFSQRYEGRIPPLEEILNKHFVSPNGRPFYIINGAIAAANQPMQAIAFLLFHDLADAVVSLDGYNEHFTYGSQLRLETPPGVWNELMLDDGNKNHSTLWKSIVFRLYSYIRENPVLSRSYTFFLFGYSLVATASRSESGMSHNPIPILPIQMDLSERKELFAFQYKKYLMAIFAIARARNMQSAFFIQPVPAISKPLTKREIQIVGNLSYKADYLDLTGRLLALKKAGLPIFSLIDIFKDHKDELYIDPIHFLGDSDGDKKLAEAIAVHLQSAWRLRKK